MLMDTVSKSLMNRLQQHSMPQLPMPPTSLALLRGPTWRSSIRPLMHPASSLSRPRKSTRSSLTYDKNHFGAIKGILAGNQMHVELAGARWLWHRSQRICVLLLHFQLSGAGLPAWRGGRCLLSRPGLWTRQRASTVHRPYRFPDREPFPQRPLTPVRCSIVVPKVYTFLDPSNWHIHHERVSFRIRCRLGGTGWFRHNSSCLSKEADGFRSILIFSQRKIDSVRSNLWRSRPVLREHAKRRLEISKDMHPAAGCRLSVFVF